MSTPQFDQTPPAGNRFRSILTILALVVIVSVTAGVLLVLPTGFIGPVFVFGGLLFFGVVGFHYLVWGYWLSRILRDEASDESDRE